MQYSAALFKGMAEQEWILWSNKEPVTALIQEKQTDSRSVMRESENDIMNQSATIHQKAVIPQANRYHAVLQRMSTASKKATAFSAWNN